jgi:hypothetical protein
MYMRDHWFPAGLNRDLAELCTCVAAHEARLLDGRRLIFAVGAARHPALDASMP